MAKPWGIVYLYLVFLATFCVCSNINKRTPSMRLTPSTPTLASSTPDLAVETISNISESLSLDPATRLRSIFLIKGLPLTSSGECGSSAVFAADNTASIYINGLLLQTRDDWMAFDTVAFNIKPGGVIAIEAADRGFWYGAIAALRTRGYVFQTGVDQWRAIAADASLTNSWMMPEFDACNWPRAKLRPGRGTWNPGKSTYFPYDTGAEYVWADGVGENGKIFLRYRLGGECGKRALLSFATAGKATVYINDHAEAISTTPHAVVKIRSRLRVGDVVSVLAGVQEGGHAGGGEQRASVAMSIKFKGGSRSVGTGRTLWRARVVSGTLDVAWLRHSVNSCGWDAAEVDGEAGVSPFGNKAKYVTLGEDSKQVLLRYVVGEEQCECGELPSEIARGV